MTILVVEDNKVSSKIVLAHLKKAQYDTAVAHNGREAVECLEAIPDIRLVIADIMMPEMSGLDLLRKMHETPAWKDIPVIMCTSLADAEHVKMASRLGCRHYILKPFHGDVLLQKVTAALKHEEPVLKPMYEVKEQLDLDTGTYKEMAAAFRFVVDEQIAAVEGALETPDGGSAPVDLAKLAEGAAILGAERLLGVVNDELAAQDESTPAKTRNGEYRLLLRELRLLVEALPMAASPQEKAAPAFDATTEADRADKEATAPPSVDAQTAESEKAEPEQDNKGEPEP